LEAHIFDSILGNTHEDIDGIFGVIKRYLEKHDWKTIAELKALILEALRSINVRTVIVDVRDVLDFKSLYTPLLKPYLSKLSYSGARGTPGTDDYTAHNPGYHKLSIARSPSSATPATASLRK
jgi:hypothetical protein